MFLERRLRVIDRISQSVGNYRLVRLLGQGGFADVYLGEHIHLNTYAAIKVLRTQLAEDSVENFRAEARTLAHLKHPNIVQVLDFGVDGMTPYLVMEYAPNGTLRQRHARGKQVPIDVVVKYVKQIASALQFAHNQKLIHRDIKPENMLVGEQEQILLSDFGIAVMTASARAADPAQADANWNPAGTVAYMAPEQIQGKTVPASDQYALAIVVYEWLTGATPFNGHYMEVAAQQISASPPSLCEKAPSLSPDVEQVVLTALNKDPQRRFGRIEAFAMALEQATQTESAAAPSPVSIIIQPNKSSEVSAMEASLVGPLGRTTLGSTKITIGRAPDNTLVLNDPKASSHHAEIRPEGQYYSLVDLGSTNGTFVNEQQVYSGMLRMLQGGDVLRIGDTKFTFEVGAAQGAAYSDGSTVRATPPPPPGGAAPGFAGNTSYGVGNPGYLAAQPYQETVPSPSSYTPSQPSETQMPTYIPSSYGQPAQQPSYTPPQYGSPPVQQPSYTPSEYGSPPAQQPSYTPSQPPAYTPQQQPAYTSPAPLYNPPPAQQPKRSPARVIILAVIALVIILGGVIGFFVVHGNQVAQSNTNATATASHSTATAQAQAREQATAHAAATATALVTSHYPPFTNLAFSDPLTSSNDTQWAATSACQPASAGYQVSIQQNNEIQWCRHAATFGDFAYQVTMNIQQGDCGGLIFRYVDVNNFFLFDVCSDGTYNLQLLANNQWQNLHNTFPSSSAIQQGKAQNVIAVTVQGDTINMFVNNQKIDTATDSALVGGVFSQGQIAFDAYDTGDPTTVTYTNALVWTTSSS
jgi:serine/threonine protein kinase